MHDIYPYVDSNVASGISLPQLQLLYSEKQSMQYSNKIYHRLSLLKDPKTSFCGDAVTSDRISLPLFLELAFSGAVYGQLEPVTVSRL